MYPKALRKDDLDGAEAPDRDPALTSANGWSPAPGQNDKLDITTLRLPQTFESLSDVRPVLQTVPVGKPPKMAFFRIHSDPEWQLTLGTVTLDTGEVYAIDRSLIAAAESDVVKRVLYTGITRQGVLFLWAVKVPDELGNLDPWNQSAHAAAKLAMTRWARLTSNRHLGAYVAHEAAADLGEPTWPDLSFDEVIQVAFRGRYITSMEHPVLRRLRGEIPVAVTPVLAAVAALTAAPDWRDLFAAITGIDLGRCRRCEVGRVVRLPLGYPRAATLSSSPALLDTS